MSGVLTAGPYEVGMHDSNTCPYGFVKMSSSPQCEAAAAHYSKTFNRVDSWSHLPAGCFWFHNEQFYFNTHVGSSTSLARPLCINSFRSGEWQGAANAYASAGLCSDGEARWEYFAVGASGSQASDQYSKCTPFPDVSGFEATGTTGSTCAPIGVISLVSGGWTGLQPRSAGDTGSFVKVCTVAITSQFGGTFTDTQSSQRDAHHSTCCGTTLSSETDCRYQATPICKVAKRIDCTKCPHADCEDASSGMKCSVTKRIELVKVCFEKTGWVCDAEAPATRQCYTVGNIPTDLAGTEIDGFQDWCSPASATT